METEIKERDHFYASYAEAEAACAGYGYEKEDLVEAVYQKSRVYWERLQQEFEPTASEMQLLDCIQTILDKGRAEVREGKCPLHVLDFGGACGVHFFVVRTSYGVPLRWHVVETPVMAKRARHGFSIEGLHFYDDLDMAIRELGSVDLAHASGVLPSVPRPYEALETLLGCEADFVILSRLALTMGNRDIVAVHESKLSVNGPGPLPEGMENGLCRYPVTFIQKAVVDEMVQQRYDILAEFPDVLGFRPDTGTAYFLCKK